MEGRRCDRCKENKHNRQNGCVDCPDCYNLVQSAVDDHRRHLAELENTLKKINSSPTVISDSDFEKELKNVQDRVRALLNVAIQGSGSNYYCFLLLLLLFFRYTLYLPKCRQIHYININFFRKSIC